MAKKKKETPTPKDYLKTLTQAMWACVLVGIVVAIAVFVLISFTKMPDSSELENPKYEVSTKILDDDDDGKLEEIGRYFKHNRDWLTFDEINPHLVNALVATEDERFFSHSGIDARGTMRAVAYLSKRGGASTITQQLAKQFFTDYNRNFVKRVWQKLKEWTIAVQFEKRYTKEEILAMYLNKAELLNQSYGISAASKNYFGKEQQDLAIEEAAVLIGMLKNPDLYNPKSRPESAFKRRSVVLRQLVRNDYLTQEEYDSLKEIPIDMSNFRAAKNFDGPAPYFRTEATKELNYILNQDRYKKPDGTKYDIYTDGLKIYTTINLPMQRHAEAAARDHMERIQNQLSKVWSKRDPWTYKADEKEKNIRKQSLNRKVQESQRFQDLKSVIMQNAIVQMTEKFPEVRMRNVDIKRMISESKTKGYLDGLVKKKLITSGMSSNYKEAIRSEVWPVLKEEWTTLQKKAQKVFNTKRKMKVFAYNDKMEKTVTMTPLDSIKYHAMIMQIGSVSLDPKTGFVKTWVGGIGHDYFKYDHIRQSNRQIGSTFKPFLYTVALDKGISPCQKVEDRQYVIPAGGSDFGLIKTWAPSNSKDFSGKMVTLKEGLRHSMNSVSVHLVKELQSVEPIRDLVGRLGMDKNKVPSSPSIVLGSSDLTVMDMAGAYTAYANNGMYSNPIFIKRIEDKNGRIIYNYVPKQRKVIPPGLNYAMVDLLKNVVHHRADKFKSEIAGKTGTTNDHVDGWFVGFTPELVTATWVGGSERWIRFLTIADGQGAVMARPFFEKFLSKIENDPTIPYDESARFVIPEGELIQSDCNQVALLEQKLRAQDEKAKKVDETEEDF